MVTITLPDGAQKQFEQAVITPMDVAKAIGPRLAAATIGAVVDGQLCDANLAIKQDATLALVTAKPEDAHALYLIRHSTAHVMAEAIVRLFPEAKLAYGPPVENGYYYDIELEHKLTADDLLAIETEMKKIVAEDRPFTRYELAQDVALAKLAHEGNPYKVDNAQRAINADPQAVLTFYATGTPGSNWEDLCRGPHVPSTSRVGAFKLMSVAGAYWHGDEKAQQLQRVYGTAFPTQKDLDAYLNALEEAKRRDHRVIGKQMSLFTISPLVGAGLILWLPKGAVLRTELEQYMREELMRRGYNIVYSPQIGNINLYKASGHYPYYKESQFPTIRMNERDPSDDSEYLLRPMNCPHHIQMYAHEPRSYRDLPLRLAEFGTVYRYEQTGELNGMTRVRGFTQDDAHLFCTPEQVEAEFRSTVQMVMHVFNTLGFKDYDCRVSLRDPASTKYMGEAAVWDKAEAILRKVVREVNIPHVEGIGEAAFYGPKIDFMVKDCIGRKWQLGTVQLDFNLPERFQLEYIGADNQTHRPVMIHRAPFGSMERFTGILIEHFAGAFPTWLSPVQVAVLSISEKTEAYAREIAAQLQTQLIRTETDFGPDKIGAKIRRARETKVPYMLILGAKEAQDGTVAIRTRKDKDLGTMPVADFVQRLKEEIRTRQLELMG
jgi:threonyl-tRNA synthetase